MSAVWALGSILWGIVSLFAMINGELKFAALAVIVVILAQNRADRLAER